MSDWLLALQTASSPPRGLIEFAGTQPSLVATWQNSLRGDWVIWMAANGFAGANTPRDIVDATVLLADFAPASAWRRAVRLTASVEDSLRRINLSKGDFDLGQIVAHVYLASALGSLAGFAAYTRAAGHSVLVREAIGAAWFFALLAAVTVIAQAVWKESVKRATVGLTIDSAVPMALQVAVRVSDRSDTAQQLAGARLMRKRLAPPVASSGGS